MQIKNNEPNAAIDHEQKVHEANKPAQITETSKAQDIKRQAEQQADKGRDWEKFAQKGASNLPQSVADVAQHKQIEASKESARIDIEAKLREQSIKA